MTTTMEFKRSRSEQQESPALAPGEFLLTADDFQQIAAMLYADAGISLPEAKATLVYSRLAKRVRALGLESFRDYCALVSGSDGVGERQRMLAAMTTNVTHFFREPHHFEHLKTHALPPLLKAANRGGRVRIWSAGCSSGQEPFSIALTIFSLMPRADLQDIKVLATDIDPYMIECGRNATYGEAALAGMPVELRNRYFVSRRDNGERIWAANDQLRRLVSFKELNLNGPWPMKGRFQAIFCRNVVIYFDQETQQNIWTRFAPLLTPGGWLYVGHSERVSGPAASEFASKEITTYRLREGAK
jgi:chemotaxis protein methyltransferase CheR